MWCEVLFLLGHTHILDQIATAVEGQRQGSDATLVARHNAFARQVGDDVFGVFDSADCGDNSIHGCTQDMLVINPLGVDSIDLHRQAGHHRHKVGVVHRKGHCAKRRGFKRELDILLGKDLAVGERCGLQHADVLSIHLVGIGDDFAATRTQQGSTKKYKVYISFNAEESVPEDGGDFWYKLEKFFESFSRFFTETFLQPIVDMIAELMK